MSEKPKSSKPQPQSTTPKDSVEDFAAKISSIEDQLDALIADWVQPAPEEEKPEAQDTPPVLEQAAAKEPPTAAPQSVSPLPPEVADSMASAEPEPEAESQPAIETEPEPALQQTDSLVESSNEEEVAHTDEALEAHLDQLAIDAARLHAQEKDTPETAIEESEAPQAAVNENPVADSAEGSEDMAGMELAQQIQSMLDQASPSADETLEASADPEVPTESVDDALTPAAVVSESASPGETEPGNEDHLVHQIDHMLAEEAALKDEEESEIAGEFESPEQIVKAEIEPESEAVAETPEDGDDLMGQMQTVDEVLGEAAQEPAPEAQPLSPAAQAVADELDAEEAIKAPEPAKAKAVARPKAEKPQPVAEPQPQAEAPEEASDESESEPESPAERAQPLFDRLQERSYDLLITVNAPFDRFLTPQSRSLIGWVGIATSCVAFTLIFYGLFLK